MATSSLLLPVTPSICTISPSYYTPLNSKRPPLPCTFSPSSYYTPLKRPPAAVISKEYSYHFIEDYEDDDYASSGAPWLMLPPTFIGGDTVCNFYDLTKNKVLNFDLHVKIFDGDTEVVGSSHGFLALFHKRTHTMYLLNPLSGTSFHLPSIHTLSLADLGFKISPLDLRPTKVVISHDHSRALMIFGPANRLAFCCPDRSTAWTPLPLGTQLFTITKNANEVRASRAYGDMVYSKRDKAFTCCTPHHIDEWDLRLSRAGQQVNLLNQCYFNSKSSLTREDCDDREAYLVLMDDQLNYVVYRYITGRPQYMNNYNDNDYAYRRWSDRYPHKTIGFDVYKVSRVGVNKLQLDYMEQNDKELDNLVMFVGRNHSFALPANTYPGLKSGSIYFTDNPRHTPVDWQTYGACDTAIYSYKNRRFYPILDDVVHNYVFTVKGIVPPPIWFTPSPHT